MTERRVSHEGRGPGVKGQHAGRKAGQPLTPGHGIIMDPGKGSIKILSLKYQDDFKSPLKPFCTGRIIKKFGDIFENA